MWQVLGGCDVHVLRVGYGMEWVEDAYIFHIHIIRHPLAMALSYLPSSVLLCPVMLCPVLCCVVGRFSRLDHVWPYTIHHCRVENIVFGLSLLLSGLCRR